MGIVCKFIGSVDGETGKGELVTVYCDTSEKFQAAELKLSRPNLVKHCKIEVYGEIIDDSISHFWNWKKI